MTALKKSIMIAICLVLGTSRAGAEPIDNVKLAIVKLIVTTTTGAGEEGAGFIVAAHKGKLYIATAFHVIEHAATVNVRFHDYPADTFKVTIFERFDEDKDLAVVFIKDPPPFVDDIPKLRVGSSEDIKETQAIRAVGHPRGHDWEVSVGEVRDALDPLYLRFAGDAVDPGNSGGVVVDIESKLVGMVVKKDPGDGYALKIEAIISVLKSWQVPIGLDDGSRWYTSKWFLGSGTLVAAAVGVAAWLWPDPDEDPDLPGPPNPPSN